MGTTTKKTAGSFARAPRRAAARYGLWSVVLAAGGSTRLGHPKQLVRVGRKTLLERTVRMAAGVTPGRVIVVLGAERLRLRRLLQSCGLRPRVVINAGWQGGLGASLRAGLGCVPREARGALVLLCDQPAVTVADLHELIAAWRRRPAAPAASAYAGRLGVPAVLPRAVLRALPGADGDRGAREMLRGHGRTTEVALPAAAVDIDTPEDLQRFQAISASARRSRS